MLAFSILHKAVPGVKVTLTNTSNGITVETQTSSAGFYRFSSRVPGAYEVSTISLPLSTGQTRDLNINVEVVHHY